MLKVDFIKPKSAGITSCATQKDEQYTYMCFESECRQRLLCQTCTLAQHSVSHKKHIIKRDEYLQTLISKPLENAKKAADSLSRLLTRQTELTENVQEALENHERELIEFFDDVKYEINKLLDFAYEKEITKIRRSHEKQISKISEAFCSAKHLQNLYSTVVKKNIQKPFDESDLSDLADTPSLVYNQQSSLSISLQKECKNLNALFKKEQETQSIRRVKISQCSEKISLRFSHP